LKHISSRNCRQSMPPFVTEAVILHSTDFQEKDRLVTFYGDERGKMRGVAKGAKRSRRRFGANLDLLAHVTVRGFERPNAPLVRIDGADMIDYYRGARADLMGFARACYLAEWVSGCTAERHPLPGLLGLLLRVLELLDRGKGGEGLLRIFETRVLDLAGYGPKLDRCVVCDGDLKGPKVRFMVERGGVICGQCAGRERAGVWVSLGTIRALEEAKRVELDRIHRLALTPLAVEESRMFLQAFYAYHVGRRLRSAPFLEGLGKGMVSPQGKGEGGKP
jgi:DNA repair protein RecO (recombination protein O)